MAAQKVRGLATYAPSIEKIDGMPISYWKSLLTAMPTGTNPAAKVAEKENE